MIKEIIALGAISVGSAIGISCGENGQYLPAESGSQTLNIDGIKGDGFKIERIGTNVFKITGDDREAGTWYLSEHCKVLSVGAWQLNGVYGSSIGQIAVTVKENDCLPELK